ncbi:MAG TPA: ThiF family adenylyltransferase [Chitinophagaceae bacterium]|nr:ThiF family adenylyltransferase [Chitinophagaceae bacterium]
MSAAFYSRQEYFCPAKNLEEVRVLIVGCGAIGRNVASCVARLGVKSIDLVDNDIVEAHNIIPQNWSQGDCGKTKVEVLAEEIVSQMGEAIKVSAYPNKWAPRIVGKNTTYDAVWSTVDNIDIRKLLYNYYRDKCKYFFDVRIGASVAQILTVKDMETTNDWYLKTIFPSSESASFGCVQPMSNYIANIAAGTSVNQFANLMGGKGWPVHRMLSFCSINSVLSPENPDEYFGNCNNNNEQK